MTDSLGLEKSKEYSNLYQKADEFLMRLQELEAGEQTFGLGFIFISENFYNSKIDISTEKVIPNARKGMVKLYDKLVHFKWLSETQQLYQFLQLMERFSYICKLKCPNEQDAAAEYPSKQDVIEKDPSVYCIAPEGYKHLFELRKTVNSSQVFISTWFHEDTNDTNSIVEGLIRDNGLTPF
ncbi:MAG: hypothetical protein SFT81_08025 [Candidatus Caenarcaniphilales bacterium]|nr:hypothetical protein [Candidatus Caenarcaniphilales bacterium]